MPVFHDQLGNQLKLTAIPHRIISLVPSQSEYLWDLGIKPVGITKFCIHPDEMFRTIERVGGTKSLDLEKIRQLKPDLIIGNREENELKQIRELQNEFPVYMSDIITVNDALKMMSDLAMLCDREKEGQKLLTDIERSLDSIRNYFIPQTVLYFMWNNPYMAAAGETFIDSVLSHAGFKNAVSHLQRYPIIDTDTLTALKPDLCFLSSEPFPFKEVHIAELQKVLPDSKIVLVDGEMFSWYGSRLSQLHKYIKILKSELTEK